MAIKQCDQCRDKYDDHVYDVCPYSEFHTKPLAEVVASSQPPYFTPLSASYSLPKACYYCGRRDGGHTGLCHPEAKLEDRRK